MERINHQKEEEIMYRLLQSILEFKAGYLMQTDNEFGYLGQLPWGWAIPLFIIDREPKWFQKVELTKIREADWLEGDI